MKSSAPNARDVQLWKRLLLVAVIGSVPLFVVSLVLITRYYSASIDFVQRELHGIAFQRPLEQLLDLVPRYEAAARKAVGGDALATQETGVLRKQIDDYVELVGDNYNGEFGRRFGFSDAKLAPLGRDKARLSVLQSNWGELRQSPTGRDPAAARMIDSIREMIRNAGDFSFLILDDRLDTYYLVDVTLGSLPRVQQRLGENTLAAGDLLRGAPTVSSRMRFAVMAALITNGDQDRIVQDARLSIAQDKVHGDGSELLYVNLPPAVDAYVAANQAFLNLLQHAAAGDKVGALDLESAGWKAHAESFHLWQVSADELERLLSNRMRYIERQRMQYYVVIGITLAFVAIIMGWIIRSLLSARYAEMSKTNELLRSSAEKFLKAFQSNPSGLSISEVRTGRFIEVNESLCQLYGYTPKEIVGHTSVELGIYQSEDERQQMVGKLREKGFLRDFEIQTHNRGGDLRTILINAELIQIEGEECLVSAIMDVTEQKRAREEMIWKTAFLEAQIYSSLDGILVVDDRARRILQNPRLFELFKVPEDVAHDGDDSQLLRHVAEQAKDPMLFVERVSYLYAHRDEVGRDEIELKDGSILDRYSAPVRDRSGKYYGRIWTFRDITEQRKLERQLRQAQKMEAIGTLAGGIAHDFNNILAVIMGYTEILQLSNAGNPEQAGYLAAIAGAGERAKGLVRQILTFSRQEETQRQPMKLAPVAKEAMKFLRSTIPSTIEIQVDLAEDVPLVLADATQVHQIVMNLGTNAWHAMRGRPGKLHVKLEQIQVDQALAETSPQLSVGSYALLSVGDNGKGMDEATLARIFEPFFTTKVVGEGTGLGLSVVHGIMQSHDGAITVSSKPGVGTTFHLYFPAHGGAGSTADAKDAVVPRGNGQRLLYLDDELPLSILGKKFLEGLGYSVEASTDAVNALELIRADPKQFDLVVVDQAMPAMSGIDFAREVGRLRPGLPIILTTGYIGQLTLEHLRSVGIREILPKPPTIQSIGILVHKVLTDSSAN
jgi:PAS domain S-box-containing protein